MEPYKKDMILGALFVMIETGFELFIPIMISNLIDIGVANHDVNYIYVKGVQMALLALGALVTGLLYAHFSAKASYGWGAEIRKAEYVRVQQYAFSNLDHFVTSSLITRMTTDVNVLQNMIISGFRPSTRGPSLLIMGSTARRGASSRATSWAGQTPRRSGSDSTTWSTTSTSSKTAAA